MRRSILSHRAGRAAPRITGLVTVALLAVSCSDPFGPAHDELEDATRTWVEAGAADYSFVFDRSCFCALIGPVRLTVEDGELVDAEALEGSTAPGTRPPLEQFETIDGLLARLDTTLDQEPVVFEVEYDPTYGYPTRVQIDISEQIADEEVYYEIRGFTALAE